MLLKFSEFFFVIKNNCSALVDVVLFWFWMVYTLFDSNQNGNKKYFQSESIPTLVPFELHIPILFGIALIHTACKLQVATGVAWNLF